MKDHLNQIHTKLSIVFFCYLLFHCASYNSSSKDLNPSAISDESKQVTLSDISKNSIQFSHSVVYYELPDTSLVQNPDDYLTFSQPVKNISLIDRLKTILISNQQIYLLNPPNDCNPNFNSALIFNHEEEKNIILFSINCGVFYLYKDKLFIDISQQLIQIENTFRMIRSGR